MRNRLLFALGVVATAACARPRTIDAPAAPAAAVVPADSGERHLAEIRQLTFGGENAEAYFSADGRRLTFQSTRDGRACDQQYVMDVDGRNLHRVSDGTGKTTCGYFHADDRRVFFASTHAVDTACPPRPDRTFGYVWGLDPFDIYSARPDGSDLRRLTHYGVYTAEGTLSPDGRLLGRRLVRPGRMELWIMNADGTGQRQITSLGGANFAPFFTPDGRRIIFSSNHPNPRSRNFDLYLVNADGTGLEQVTTNPDFDGFPQFSPDGRSLVWASNRAQSKPGETNVFIARWRD